MKLTERMKNTGYIKSAEQSQDTPRVPVAEHLPQQSIEFTEMLAKDGSRVGIAMNQGDRVYNERYSQWIRKDMDREEISGPEALARVINMDYNFVRSGAQEESHTFERPATYIVDNEGTLVWSANDKPETVGMVLVRKDGSVTQLGTTDIGERAGVISGITPEDTLYLASNTTFADMKSVDAFKTNTFEEIMKDDSYPADLVRVNFNSAVSSTDSDTLDAASRNMTPAEQRRNKARIRDERRAKNARNDTKNTSPDEDLPDEDLTRAFAADVQARLAAAQAHANGGALDKSSLGISEMVRLEMEKAEEAEMQRITNRVDKYTRKVASYEELAAEALANRMKGRLFNPLTRKGKNEARKDDQYMHLLEGYSRVLDAALMQQWLSEGHSDDEVAMKIYEHQQTRQEARAARNQAELRKDKLGSLLDRYANMSKGKKIGATIGALAAFGVIGAGLTAAGGVVAVTGGVVLAGAKVSKAYYQHRSKMYETGSKDPMRSPDKPVSVKNGEAATRTAIEQVFVGRQYDEKKREKAIQKADRNKKVAAGLAAASAIGIGTIGAGVLMEHADTIQETWNKLPIHGIPTEVGNADGSWVTEAPVATPDDSAAAAEQARQIAAQHAEVLNSPVHIIPDGGGGEAYTIANGVDAGLWYQNQDEFLQLFPSDAYRMSDGNVGFSHPGELSDSAKEYWAKKFGKWL